MQIRFERFNDWTEKWQDCTVDDLIDIDNNYYIDGKLLDLSDFLKALLEKLKDQVEVFEPVEEQDEKRN